MTSKVGWYADLVAVLVLSLLMPLLIYVIPLSSVRAALGLMYILFSPGYALIAALFPRKHDMEVGERLAISLGLSIALAPLVGLVLDFTPWGITLESILVSLTSLTLLACAAAYYRRSCLLPEERFKLGPSRWQDVRQMKFFPVALILICVAIFGAIVWVAVKPKSGTRLTEFYLLEPGAQAEWYPAEFSVGEPMTLILGVVNREYGDVEYRIERAGSAGREQIATLQLGHEETWEYPYTFTLTEQGEDQKIEFLLYKGDEQEPYRSLHLWITVEEQQ